MKHVFYLAILMILCLSCDKNKDKKKDINHLIDLALEVDNRTNVGSNQSEIFNFYIYAVKFNSDGNYIVLDDNYGQFDYWTHIQKNRTFKYTIEDESILFEVSRNGEILEHKWEIIEVETDYLRYSEKTQKGTFIHKISISNKQEIR